MWRVGWISVPQPHYFKDRCQIEVLYMVATITTLNTKWIQKKFFSLTALLLCLGSCDAYNHSSFQSIISSLGMPFTLKFKRLYTYFVIDLICIYRTPANFFFFFSPIELNRFPNFCLSFSLWCYFFFFPIFLTWAVSHSQAQGFSKFTAMKTIHETRCGHEKS